jgi:hypothetical protein
MMNFWLIRLGVASVLSGLLPVVLPVIPQVKAQAARPSLRVVVNSAQDGPIQADQGLTLREAIALTNGILKLEVLSAIKNT